jgi:DNA repair protein RecO (recombination protein O)
MGGVFDLLNQVEIVFYAKEQLELISQGDLIASYPHLKSSLQLTLTALNSCKLLDQLLPLHQQEPAAYTIFAQLLVLLEAGQPPEQTGLAAELKLLSVLGHRPQLSACVRCGSTHGTFRFAPAVGGVLCEKCAKEGLSVNRGLGLSLNTLIDNPLERAGIVRLKDHDVQLAHQLIDLYIEHITGHRRNKHSP